MEKLPPFMNSTGLIPKIFEKIQEAKEPDDRYTQNFQSAVLGFGSGQAKMFIPFLKRMGFLEADGRPTKIYRQFRNPDSAPAAMAEAMRIGFHDVFNRNEYAHNLTDEKLRNLLVEMTGKDKASSSIQKIVATWKACKVFADFDAEINDDPQPAATRAPPSINVQSPSFEDTPMPERRASMQLPQSVGMSFGYNIHLNLPATTDAKVYNAIFSALQQTLLKE